MKALELDWGTPMARIGPPHWIPYRNAPQSVTKKARQWAKLLVKRLHEQKRLEVRQLGFFVTIHNLLSQSVFGRWKMVRVPNTKNNNHQRIKRINLRGFFLGGLKLGGGGGDLELVLRNEGKFWYKVPCCCFLVDGCYFLVASG